MQFITTGQIVYYYGQPYIVQYIQGSMVQIKCPSNDHELNVNIITLSLN